MPDHGIVSFAPIEAYSKGDHLARPLIGTARYVGAGEATHDVRVVELDAVVEATSFEELHG